MEFEGTKPAPFASDENTGRGTTLEKAINDAIKKRGAGHGEVFEVKLFVSVSNPHVGEYIVYLG
jgi:hypothetical protein